MLMKSHKIFYIISKSNVLEDFEKAFDQIVSFHEDTFYPKLQECADNTEKIFELFKETLEVSFSFYLALFPSHFSICFNETESRILCI